MLLVGYWVEQSSKFRSTGRAVSGDAAQSSGRTVAGVAGDANVRIKTIQREYLHCREPSRIIGAFSLPADSAGIFRRCNNGNSQQLLWRLLPSGDGTLAPSLFPVVDFLQSLSCCLRCLQTLGVMEATNNLKT
ncbi:hypothetical protein L1887_29717 [Cichorium endivia]|nr:hypothetical protein L1887_29717 [Cichorium endivia]